MLLGVLAFVVYNANLRALPSGDSLPARYLPFALWSEGTLHLDAFERVVAPPGVDPYWVGRSRDGHLVSRYPVVTPLVIAPLYAPAIAYLSSRGASDERLQRLGELMEKLAASAIGSATAGLMFVLLRRRLPPGRALLLACAFAFGTNQWVTSSQTLFQHGTASFFVVLSLLVLTGPASASHAALAGLLAGLVAANRPPDAALAVGLVAAGLRWAPGLRARAVLLGAAAIPVALFLQYNLRHFGSLAGGYGALGVTRAAFYPTPFLGGVAGLLVSPAKGLFVFSPFLLLLPAFPARVFAERRDRFLNACLLLAFALQIALYAKTDWRGGYCYGPRFLVDALPILIWTLTPAVAAFGRAGIATFVAALAAAVAIQAVGAFYYSGASDALYFAPRSGLRAVWAPCNAPFVIELGAPTRPSLIRGILHYKAKELGLMGD